MSGDLRSSMKSLFKTFEEEEPRENEYRGEDGLLYCGKCNTPVQCKTSFLNEEHIVRCMCKCQAEAYKREQEEEKERQRQMMIRNLKASGIQDRHIWDWNFSMAEENKDIRMAKRYVENWKKVKAENLGLLLWGEVGSGKSFTAACIANALIEQGVSVLMTNFSKILNQMGAMYSDERYRYIASLNHYPLLIIDDLGIERNTEYALEQVYAVIDERYKSGLPVIITTNLTIAELRNPEDVPHARIYSRILEMCTPINVSGGDRRKAINRNKQEVVKEVLDL